MDKSWIRINQRTSSTYKNGVKEFLKFAYANKRPESEIKCPCLKCKNSINQREKIVYEHSIMYGFLENYTSWVYHGEEPIDIASATYNNVSEEQDDIEGMLHDVFRIETQDHEYQVDNKQPKCTEGINEEAEHFYKLLKDAERELYPGCRSFTFLAFIVRLLNVKTINRWSNKSFSMLLELLKEAFPHNECFPSNYREAWKIIKDLGLQYRKIHACPNDCLLYIKDMEKEKECKICHTPRYKQFDDQLDGGSRKERKIPAKLVRYFPLKPRLQRLFMSSKTASLMRWHVEGRRNDGVLRHPADSLAWRTFDEKYPSFASDCRNVRLGLASDGFNPFKTMSVTHSTWPVILIPYNLPPDLCMKQSSFMLCLLIDGPRSPGNDIDVYLQLLVDELKELWEPGLPTYDAVSKEIFSMRAALIWTISDFPGYAMLSGWSTKGALACPWCNKDTRSDWLKHSRKFCYMSHRRFLASNHKFCKDRVSFDGTVEYGTKPVKLSGVEILEQLNGVTTEYGKGVAFSSAKKRKLSDHNWKKKSIFFNLAYWHENLNPHNFDIMHIEKNIGESLTNILLGIPKKSKDNERARYDLSLMGIRKALHPQQRGGKKVYLPAACFTMSKKEKDTFCQVLKNVKVPDGYASNISRNVNLKEHSISGLKSHDYHIMLQQLIPIAVRRTMPKHVSKPLIELGNCFRQLYSKENRVQDLQELSDCMALTLCHMEKIFPPSFFDIMEHLPIHLPEEALLAGPVQFRSMYPVERYLSTLKNYVRSRRYPEGSIAEGYLAEECMTFCSRYLQDVESKWNRPLRNYDGGQPFCQGSGRAFGKEELIFMDDVSWVQAHRYILSNSDLVEPYRQKHISQLKTERPRAREFEIDSMHNDQFHKWFKHHVQNMERTSIADQIPSTIKLLAAGPDKWARSYAGYIVNGYRFHTKKREMRSKTQNSGVSLNAQVQSFSSRKDKNPIIGFVPFYGVLTDIVELRYSNDLKFVLFKCDWVDNNHGKKEDDFGFTLVNFTRLLYRHNRVSDEPFILASQAQQVWYVQDPMEPHWHIVVKMKPRNSFMFDNAQVIDEEVESFGGQHLDDTTFNYDDDVTWVRSGVEGVTVEVASIRNFDEQENNANQVIDDDILEIEDDDSSKNEDNSDEDDLFSDDNEHETNNVELDGVDE